MIVEIYDAFLDAGATDDKARRAAEAMAGHEDRFHALETKIDRLDIKIDRVEANLNQKIDRVEANLNQKIDRLELTVGGRFDAMDARMDLQLERVESRLRSEQVLIRWVFGMLITIGLAIGAKVYFP